MPWNNQAPVSIDYSYNSFHKTKKKKHKIQKFQELRPEQFNTPCYLVQEQFTLHISRRQISRLPREAAPKGACTYTVPA